MVMPVDRLSQTISALSVNADDLRDSVRLGDLVGTVAAARTGRVDVTITNEDGTTRLLRNARLLPGGATAPSVGDAIRVSRSHDGTNFATKLTT